MSDVSESTLKRMCAYSKSTFVDQVAMAIGNAKVYPHLFEGIDDIHILFPQLIDYVARITGTPHQIQAQLGLTCRGIELTPVLAMLEDRLSNKVHVSPLSIFSPVSEPSPECFSFFRDSNIIYNYKRLEGARRRASVDTFYGREL